MNTSYSKKLHHILPTLLAVTIGMIAVVSVLRWLNIHYQTPNMKEDVWTFMIPAVMPWIPLLIWLRPKLRALKFQQENDKRRAFFIIVPGVMISAMLMMSQHYMSAATGMLTALKSIEEINEVPPSRYYTVQSFSIPDNVWGEDTHFNTSSSSRYNFMSAKKLTMNLYYVRPVYSAPPGRDEPLPPVWYGLKFSKTISDRLSDQEKDRYYNDFHRECQLRMYSYNYRNVEYLERMPHSDERDKYVAAIESHFRPAPENLIVLVPMHEKFEARTGMLGPQFFGSFGIGMTIFLLMLIWPGYSENKR